MGPFWAFFGRFLAVLALYTPVTHPKRFPKVMPCKLHPLGPPCSRLSTSAFRLRAFLGHFWPVLGLKTPWWTLPGQKWAVSWAGCLKNRKRGHVFHLGPPTLSGFHPSDGPQVTPRPPNRCALLSFGRPSSQAPPGGPKMDPKWVKKCQKMTFPKSDPLCFGVLKQVV